MTEEPRPTELSRRIDELRDEFRDGMKSLNERLDRMPTSELLTAYLAKSDSEMRGMREDIDEVRKTDAILDAKVDKVNTELRGEIKDARKEAAEAKRFGMQIAVAGGGLLLALVGFLLRINGVS